ncbi:hypothetical protein QZH41_015312, partial [Actinostola sp. cb2023]
METLPTGVSLQSWALNARTDVLTEIEGQLLNVIDHLRCVHTSSDVTSYSKISDLLYTVEGIRHYLFKTVEPPLSKHIKEGLTLDDVMSHMPPGLSKKKENEIHSVIEALMKAVSYAHHMQAIEIKILKEELFYHQSVYQLQLDYTNSLLSSVRFAYSEFEKRTCEMLCDPLDKILETYEALKSTASEEDLRLFLTSFKDHADKISDAVECLQAHHTT